MTSFFENILEEVEKLEKGMKTVIVPPSKGRKGYQYQRNFPNNKKENSYKGKETKTTKEKNIFKIKSIIQEELVLLDNEEKKKIKEKIKNSTLTKNNVKYHISRTYNEKSSNQHKKVSKNEFKDAYFLAKNGFSVCLPSETDGLGTYDALINGLPFDFKNITGGLETTKKQAQKGFKQARNVVIFFKNKKAIDFMRFEAIVNGATNISKKKGLAIICYEKENEIDFFDMRNIKKSGERAESTFSKDCRVITPTLSIIPNSLKKSTSTNTACSNKDTMNMNNPIDIYISDITVGNRKAKLEQIEKCLNGKKALFIPADNTKRLQNVDLHLKDNNPERIEKAIRTMSMSFDIPLKANKGEAFFYNAQQELTDKWCEYFSNFTREVYDFVTDYFNLPKKTVMQKSVLTHKGKIIYNPNTGEPIKQSEWESFIKNLEKFFNRNKSKSEKIILQSHSLAKILNRMLKYNTLEKIKEMPLKSIEYHKKSFDWISDNIKNMKNTFGESFTRQQMARMQVLTQSASEKVTNITEKMRGEIKQILIDGVKNKQTKSQVSQNLFDKMVGDNRDFQRLADTEIQNAFNNAFLQEEVYNANENEKVYFERIEIIDANTCPFCKQMNGKIVLWFDKPQASEKINDEVAEFAIWEGKEWNGKDKQLCTGVFHPFCRGSWVRYDKDASFLDAIVAQKSNKAKKWNEAVKQATKEFNDKGIKKPDDTTKGFTERIKEIFNGEEVKKSNPNHDSLGRFTFGKVKFSPNIGGGSGSSQNTSSNANKLTQDEERCIIANQTQAITGIEPLKLQKHNYSTVIHEKIKEIDNKLKNGNYKYNDKKITSVDEEHFLSHFMNGKIIPRDFNDVTTHAAYIPFIIPMLNGKCGHDKNRDRIEKDGRKTYEFIKKATITENGNKKNIGIALILKENEHGDELSVSIRSVFRLWDKNNLIKSRQAGEQNLLDRNETSLFYHRDFIKRITLVSFFNLSTKQAKVKYT